VLGKVVVASLATVLLGCNKAACADSGFSAPSHWHTGQHCSAGYYMVCIQLDTHQAYMRQINQQTAGASHACLARLWHERPAAGPPQHNHCGAPASAHAGSQHSSSAPPCSRCNTAASAACCQDCCRQRSSLSPAAHPARRCCWQAAAVQARRCSRQGWWRWETCLEEAGCCRPAAPAPRSTVPAPAARCWMAALSLQQMVHNARTALPSTSGSWPPLLMRSASRCLMMAATVTAADVGQGARCLLHPGCCC
jgi:hypothetical protein